MPSMTPALLRAEILSDPSALGYLALAAADDDVGIAEALNRPRAGIIVFRSDVAPKEIIQAIAPTDFTAANQLAVSKLQLILLPGVVDATLANVRGSLQNLFSAATQPTKNDLVAVCSRPGSRAEQLFGPGTTIDYWDVARARALET